jgi:hypothetical protein
MKTQHQYFQLRILGKVRDLRLIRGRYENGNMALQIIEKEDGYEEVWCVLTVNPSLRDVPGKVWIKTWSENEDTYEALVKAGYIIPSEVTCPCGFVEAVACSITEKLSAFITNA